jgi:hypothetical protein
MNRIIVALSSVIGLLVFAGCAANNKIEKGTYTCSMHPDIIGDEPGKCPICGMELVKKETSVTTAKTTSSTDMSAALSKEAADTPIVKALFTNLDAKVAVHINKIASNYMLIKDALVKRDSANAKKSATMLVETISTFDNSYFPALQKIEYDKHRYVIKEQAQQVIENADIELQKGDFAMLSNHVYDLVKAFGAGRKLYYNYCNMAFDNNGAIWLSETNAIQNPYMGAQMITCGSVEKIIN